MRRGQHLMHLAARSHGKQRLPEAPTRSRRLSPHLATPGGLPGGSPGGSQRPLWRLPAAPGGPWRFPAVRCMRCMRCTRCTRCMRCMRCMRRTRVRSCLALRTPRTPNMRESTMLQCRATTARRIVSRLKHAPVAHLRLSTRYGCRGAAGTYESKGAPAIPSDARARDHHSAQRRRRRE